MDDKRGSITFVLAHVPLLLALIWALSSPNQAVATSLSGFYVAHVVLHTIALRHPRNEFRDWVSWTLILGAGIAGTAQLLHNSLGAPAA